jgi:phosphoribosylformimino-5-aminoimidazole carboxamide ribotide isomerase
VRVIPAVDISGGKCVRLVEGDRARETVFFADPVDAARSWVDSGAAMIHVVDLDGALTGRLKNLEILERIVALGTPIEFGGGVRDLGKVQKLAEMGVARVVIGTAAFENPALIEEAAAKFGRRVVLGLDVRRGTIEVDGWTRSVNAAPVEVAQRAEKAGVGRIIFTNVARDGTMSGPDLKSAEMLASALTVPLTVSGGVSSLDDIRSVKKLSPLGVDEIIVGRALYDGAFSYEDAAEAAED